MTSAVPGRRPGRAAALGAIVLAAAALGCSDDGGSDAVELHVFTWAGYLDAEVVAGFERESGAKIVESNYSSNEEMVAKLRAGGGGWDLVCPSDYAVALLVRDGLLEPIDAARVPNLSHLGERFRAPPYDPGHAHSVPFQWGVTGIGWDSARVSDPPRTWREFFDAAKDGRHGKVSLLDDMREVLGAALLALGRSPNTRDPAEIAEAKTLLLEVKPNVVKFDSDDPAASLASGEVGLAQAWGGMVANGRRDLATLSFAVPSDGSYAYVDNWAVPKGAPHRDLALAFVDYCLRPDVAAALVTRKLYASCNETAKAEIDPAILGGACYADGGGARLWWVEDAGPAGDLYAAAWADLKAE